MPLRFLGEYVSAQVLSEAYAEDLKGGIILDMITIVLILSVISIVLILIDSLNRHHRRI